MCVKTALLYTVCRKCVWRYFVYVSTKTNQILKSFEHFNEFHTFRISVIGRHFQWFFNCMVAPEYMWDSSIWARRNQILVKIEHFLFELVSIKMRLSSLFANRISKYSKNDDISRLSDLKHICNAMQALYVCMLMNAENMVCNVNTI